MITTTPAIIAHFAAIATETIKELTNQGVLQLLTDANGKVPLDPDSDEAKKIITEVTTKIYEGLIKNMNTHLALDIK